jgi:nitrate reductase NapAB chaperone NapD
MLIVGSVINIIENTAENVKKIIEKYKEIEIYPNTTDKNKLIVVFEVENEEKLQELCSELKNYDEIIDIAHHYCNFEEEIEKIKSGKITPEVLSFKKKIL